MVRIFVRRTNDVQKKIETKARYSTCSKNDEIIYIQLYIINIYVKKIANYVLQKRRLIVTLKLSTCSGGEGFMAPIGDKTQFKDFCQATCLEK